MTKSGQKLELRPEIVTHTRLEKPLVRRSSSRVLSCTDPATGAIHILDSRLLNDMLLAKEGKNLHLLRNRNYRLAYRFVRSNLVLYWVLSTVVLLALTFYVGSPEPEILLSSACYSLAVAMLFFAAIDAVRIRAIEKKFWETGKHDLSSRGEI